MFIGHACNTYTCYNDTYTVDMKERCLLCGGSQSTVKTSHWVSKKLLIIILAILCISIITWSVLCRSNVTGVMGEFVLTVMT